MGGRDVVGEPWMFAKIALQMSSAFLKIGYILAMLWLYVSKPLLIAVGLVIVSVLAVFAVTAKTRR